MSKDFTNDEAKKLAEKLLIGLDIKEAEDICLELSFVKKSMEAIDKIEGLNNVEPLTHPYDLFEATLREDDNYQEGDSVEDLFANCDNVESNEVEVPKVVG